jgi:hypothetical protein
LRLSGQRFFWQLSTGNWQLVFSGWAARIRT